jgi:hypothetical protein
MKPSMKNLSSLQNPLRLIITLTFSIFFFVSWGQCPPYEIPKIKTEAEFGNKVYIDPSRSSNGNGSINSPHNTLQGISIKTNTAYLLKRGTVLNERINKKWDNNMISAYGDGAKPIINGGFHIQGGSRNTTFYDLDIRSDNHSGGKSAIIDFEQSPASRDITIAFCNLMGVNTRGKGFPFYVLHHGSENMIVYHNKMSNCTNNGWWLGSYANVKIVRNWITKTNLDGENKIDNSGDGIQAMFTNHNLYIAGNVIDKSNAIWKYALMLNKKEKYASNNMIVEYNTLIAPRTGNGGAGVFWRPQGGKNNVFRKNVINSHSYDGRTSLVTPIHTELEQLTVSGPYGIRDNHILVPAGKNIVFPSNIQNSLHSSNRIFNTMNAYSKFLNDNPNIGLYGSDIDLKNFWAPVCNQSAPTRNFELSFDINCNNGSKINNAVISLNGQSNSEGDYQFTNVPAGNYEYTIKAPGHKDVSVKGHTVDRNAIVSVVMVSVPTFTLTFDVKNQQGARIPNATVVFDNQPNKAGDLTFIEVPEGNYTYNVSAQGYQPISVNNLHVSKDLTVSVTMSAGLQINLSAIPLAAGSVSGHGSYNEGDIVTITASPKENYKFLHWKENGNIISTQPTLTFIADKSRNLEANYAQDKNTVIITATANPSGYAFVSGSGSYQKNETVRLTATAADNSYHFAGWIENGKRVSTEETYSFIATENRTLEARFILSTREFLVEANVNMKGAGVINGNGHYLKGDRAILSIQTEEDITFVGWQNAAGEIVSRQNPYAFEVNSDVEFSALVTKKPQDEFTLNIYPNPSNGRFFINLEEEAELKVINIAGAIIQTQMIAGASNEIDLTGLPTGVYILSFSTSEKVYNERVVIR